MRKQVKIQESQAVLRKALINACKRLNLDQKDLSQILGFSEATASRLFNNAAYIKPNSNEWALAVLFLRMYRSLDSLFGGNESQCRLWMDSNNNYLRGTPRELIKTIQGLFEVTQYLDAYRGLA